MKKLIFVIMMLIPLNVLAYVGPMDDNYFTIDNQTTAPFSVSVGSNSSTNVIFNLDFTWYHGTNPTLDLPGSYMFISIESNKQIEIHRRYAVGTNCNTSCFSNDDYLQLISSDNGYSYVYYFNVKKWSRNVGTQIDLFSVNDYFTITNKESGTATVYLYGSYADTTNQIPQYINDANTVQQIIIDGQTNTQWIIDNQNDLLGTDCPNLLNPDKSLRPFYFEGNGSQILQGGNNLIFYIPVDKNTNYTISSGVWANLSQLKFGFTSELPALNVSVYNTGNLSSNNKSTINSGNYQYLVLRLQGTSGHVIFNNNFLDFVPDFQVVKGSNKLNYCKFGSTISKIDDTNDKIDDVNNSINDLNDNITSNDIDNPNSDFSDIEDLIAHNGVITNLIALPITLYSSILNGLNQSCSTYSFGNLLGTNLQFQCINLGTLLGNTIWGVIDVLFSGFTIYAIAKKMIKVFNNFSGLQEGDVIDD